MGKHTVIRNRARILAWVSTFQSFAVRWHISNSIQQGHFFAPPPKKSVFTHSPMNMASTMKTMITMKTTPKSETCNNVRCIIYYLKKLLMTPHLDRHSTIDQNQKCYPLSKAEIELNMMKEMKYTRHWACTHFQKRRKYMRHFARTHVQKRRPF